MASKQPPRQDDSVAEHATAILTGPSGPGTVGVLLCHGFTGSPWSLKRWAEHLAAKGFRVSVPLWPGHGTTWQELNTTSWEQWWQAAERALDDLSRECDQVCVGGLSMGGALALRLAEKHPQVRAIALVNPAIATSDKRFAVLGLLSRFVASIPGIASDIAAPDVEEYGYTRTPLRAAASMTRLWADVRKNLDQVRQPILLFRSETDHVVDPTSARVLMQGVSSAEVTERILTRSYHVATMDHDAEDIFTESAEFFARHTAIGATPRGEEHPETSTDASTDQGNDHV